MRCQSLATGTAESGRDWNYNNSITAPGSTDYTLQQYWGSLKITNKVCGTEGEPCSSESVAILKFHRGLLLSILALKNFLWHDPGSMLGVVSGLEFNAWCNRVETTARPYMMVSFLQGVFCTTSCLVSDQSADSMHIVSALTSPQVLCKQPCKYDGSLSLSIHQRIDYSYICRACLR